MRSLTLVAGLVASLALTTGSGPAGAQPYYAYPPYGGYGYYPPYGGYDYYPPYRAYAYYPPPYSRPYLYHYYHHHYRHYYHPYYHRPYYYPNYHPYYHPYYRHYWGYAPASCGYGRHRAGAIGAVTGAIGGGIIGSAITHGNPAYAMVGAGLGALTGNAIARNSAYPC
jgi:hypothetical protein